MFDPWRFLSWRREPVRVSSTPLGESAAPKTLPFVIAVALIGFVMLADAVVFRSGLYTRIIEPESTAGLMTLAPGLARAQYRGEMKNILVVGDSRIGEGFSASIANDIGHPQGVNFVGLGEAGTSPRSWYYLLRDIDPRHDKYVAILLMVPSLRDDQSYEDARDRVLDTAYLMPLLRVADMRDYADSFATPALRRQTWVDLLFPEILLQADIMDFIQHPVRRYKKVKYWRVHNPQWVAGYKGRDGRMPQNDTVAPGHLPEEIRDHLAPQAQAEADDYFGAWSEGRKPVPQSQTADYRLTWFGKIADAYRGSATRIAVFLIPRGPYHAALQIPYAPQGALLQLRDAGAIALLDPRVGRDLETPDNFFDFLHMNALGREKFSRMLATAAIEDEKAGESKP